LLYRVQILGLTYCERVWFALEEKRKFRFATEFIDLNNKPKRYTDLVYQRRFLLYFSSSEGELVYGSKNYSACFRHDLVIRHCFPADPEENVASPAFGIARQLVEDAKQTALKKLAPNS